MKLSLSISICLAALLSLAPMQMNASAREKNSRLTENKDTIVRLTIGKGCTFADHADYGVYIPGGKSKLNGALVLQHGCTMEQFGITKPYDLQLQAFAKKWRLAIIESAIYGDCHIWHNPESGSAAALIKILSEAGGLSGHPELATVPWLIWGHSSGGYWTLGMLRDYPERILAAVCYSAAWDPAWGYSETAAKVPLLLRHAGDNDATVAHCKETAIHTFGKLRKMDAPVCIAYNEGQNHNFSYLRYMAIPFYEAALKQRLPRKNSGKMKNIDHRKTWVGDTSNLAIFKESKYAGNKQNMCLFPDETSARDWQEFVSTGTLTDKTAPEAPYDLKISKEQNSLVVRWKSDADIESGIMKFNIYKDNVLVGSLPGTGTFQTFDTNGDNTRPVEVPEMKFTIPGATDQTGTIGVETVNNFNLVSKRTTISTKGTCKVQTEAVLYDAKLDKKHPAADLVLNDAGAYSEKGLELTKAGAIVKLDRFYSLAERKVKYLIRPSSDAKAVFQSSTGDFKVYVDVPGKRISIETSPAIVAAVPFLEGDRNYCVEIYHVYQQSIVRISDVASKKSVEISATNDGQGGVGKGSLQKGFPVGMQWDHYCFGLTEGTSLLVKRITVSALKQSVKLLIYGDSITQPEGYFPTKDFQYSWTQRIISRLGGNAMSSGRGGGNIIMLRDYIKNELPFIKAEYVMVTIGTNGGNTEENLSELVEYIRSQGAVPILDNIPCNESGTQIECNRVIEKVREKYGIRGCRFDVPTSLKGDGQQVDKPLMFWEDYTGSYGWQVYHHPNSKGGQKMFEQTLIDIPEIYR